MLENRAVFLFRLAERLIRGFALGYFRLQLLVCQCYVDHALLQFRFLLGNRFSHFVESSRE